MATFNNRRTLVTKKMIKDSFTDLMKEKPVNKITIKEICDKADVNRSTFYMHYQDQYALLDEMENDITSSMLDYLNNASSNASSVTAILNFLSYIKKNNEIFKILLCIQTSESFERKLIDETILLLKHNFVFKDKEKEDKYTSSFVMHGCLSILKEWINHDFDLSENELAKHIYTLCNKVIK